ncbi:MAG: arginine--tRNA ligase, partial [Chloroflexales bacterium]|nr:arginine--tRNA ligase [Chloroflexales bacterium]
MDYTLDQFAAEIRAGIAAIGRVPKELIDLQAPKGNVAADLALPCFRAAKELGVAPPALASELAAALVFGPESLVDSVAASGPFLNFTLRPAALAARVLAEALGQGNGYGSDDVGAGATVVIDFSAPNVAKRMHVGHIRSTIIGQSLVNLHRALGYTVVGDNHLGDFGTGFGRLLYAIDRWGWPQSEGEQILADLEELYQRASALEASDPEVANEARRWSLMQEQGDRDAEQLGEQVLDLTLKANQRNYDRLGVQFDTSYGESFYSAMLPAMLARALERGVARREGDGSVVVKDLENLPLFLLQRSDGGSLYHTRDIATIAFREEQYHPRKVIYVVEQKQELHFRQLFALARAMGIGRGIELVHIYFGTIFDAKGQALSTRKGNMIYLETLLDDAVARARVVVEEKSPELSDAEKDDVARVVGVGAVIYNDLYQDLKRNITLDWERMLAREGNSATYLQYSYARCRSILRKGAEQRAAGELVPAQYDPALLEHEAEQGLIKHLARLPHAVREAGERCATFVIADWCYTTAREFATFYDRCPVLRAE